MTKKQITLLNKLNIPITKYYGKLMYFNYYSRGRDGRLRNVWGNKF